MNHERKYLFSIPKGFSVGTNSFSSAFYPSFHCCFTSTYILRYTRLYIFFHLIPTYCKSFHKDYIYSRRWVLLSWSENEEEQEEKLSCMGGNVSRIIFSSLMKPDTLWGKTFYGGPVIYSFVVMSIVSKLLSESFISSWR